MKPLSCLFLYFLPPELLKIRLTLFIGLLVLRLLRLGSTPVNSSDQPSRLITVRAYEYIIIPLIIIGSRFQLYTSYKKIMDPLAVVHIAHFENHHERSFTYIFPDLFLGFLFYAPPLPPSFYSQHAAVTIFHLLYILFHNMLEHLNC